MGFLTRNAMRTFTFITMKELNSYEQNAPIEKRITKIEYRAIEGTVLTRLVKRCRNENTTLTGLITACLALGVCECKGRLNINKKLKQVIFTPVSVRKECKPQIDTHVIGCFVNFYRTIHAIDLKIELWDLARLSKIKLHGAINKMANMPPNKYSKRILAKMIHSLDSGLFKNIFPYGIGVTNIGYVPFQSNAVSIVYKSFISEQTVVWETG